MGNPTFSAKDLLNPSDATNVKQYLKYDSEGNVTNIYYAQSSAADGDQCLEQVMDYTTVSGQSLLSKTKWQTAIWSGSEWDIE